MMAITTQMLGNDSNDDADDQGSMVVSCFVGLCEWMLSVVGQVLWTLSQDRVPTLGKHVVWYPKQV